MKRFGLLLLIAGLSACGSAETGGDAEACEESQAVGAQIREYRELDTLTTEQANDATQWEFRLAEASVLATDHDLATLIRDQADAAGNVAEYLDDEEVFQILESISREIDSRCE
ncbi:hypothetical protein [Flaviflexus massiliensis]|uniref:hypothetical protein n=1 Tax=Flaviflexus massiliensis TaxID=1522309 RepID=UPI0006D54012|nr:hypothetical protein [Flaviflexus massiliensis]